jgi:hypothetical protein
VATIEMVYVLSSLLDAVGYDPPRQELHVRFRAAATYVYSGVPEHVYRELLDAGSKGGFFSNVVKPSYPAASSDQPRRKRELSESSVSSSRTRSTRHAPM